MKQILFWIPRGFMVIYILFISLFALDAFDPNYSTWEKVTGFMIHIAPSVLLAVILVFSWKRPVVGAVGFLVMSIFFTFLVHGPSAGIGFYILVIPALTGSLLFLLEYTRSSRRSHRRDGKPGDDAGGTP